MRLGEHREDLVLRARVLGFSSLAALSIVALAYWRVQVVRGEHYRALAENNRLREMPIRAPRGLIYDRAGRLLVENAPSFNLLLDRSRTRDVAASLAKAGEILGRPAAEFEEIVRRQRSTPAYTPILLGENLSVGEVARVGVAALEHPELEVEAGHVRLYRQSGRLAHVLGYLGEATQGDLAGGRLAAGDWVGKKGVEQTHDQTLRGADGRRVVVVDSRGRLLEESQKTPAVAGRDLELTLDLALQQEAERAMEGQVGAVVALDPRNGEVLALVSSPAFDPNRFARRLRADDWRALLADPRHPLQNRALQNTHAPGSVFKPVVAYAALAEGVATPGHSVFCGGQTRVYGHPFRCWKRSGHGQVDLHAALRESCDVYFYHLAPKLGVDAIARHARLFGLGRASGIDLTGEKPGLVPDSEWSLAARKHPWYPGETVSVAIGQGPLLTTPMQVAVMMAMVANDGLRVTPHLVRAGDGPAPAPEDQRLDREALAEVRRGLWAVVNERGTATGARLGANFEGIEVAGKTGTAQVVAQKTWTDSAELPWEFRDHAWFASFAPVSDPRLVIVVFVEHGGKGSSVAAPVAKRMYEVHFGNHSGPRRAL